MQRDKWLGNTLWKKPRLALYAKGDRVSASGAPWAQALLCISTGRSPAKLSRKQNADRVDLLICLFLNSLLFSCT